MEHLAELPSEAVNTPPGRGLASAEANLLLATLPWGVLLVDAHSTVQYLNAQAATWWGVAPAYAQGHTLAQVGRGKLPEPLYEALRQVAASHYPPPGEYYLPATGHWLAMASQPNPGGTVVHWQAIAAPRPPAGLAPQPPSPAEARYRALFMAMEQAFCIIEKVATAPGEPSDYRYVVVNPAFAKHSGRPAAIGQTLRQLVPAVESHIVASYDEALASGLPQYFEEYVAGLDAWIAAEVLPDPQPGHLAVLFKNVSAQHRAERTLREGEARQAYLLVLSDALRPVTDAQAVQAMVTRTARHFFGADRCYYGEVEGDTVTIRQDATRPGLPSVVGTYSLSSRPVFRAVLQQEQPMVVPDVPASPALDEGFRQLCLANQVLAYIAVPVGRHDERAGLLVLAQNTPRQWTALEVALMQETAERTWVAIERARAEEALRRSEAEFRLLVTATSDVVYKMSPDWREMHQLLGKSFLADTSQASGSWLEYYIPSADQAPVQAAIAAAIAAKAPFELEHRIIQADGQVGWVHSRALPLLDAQGTITQWLGAAQDVTARKQAEAQLQSFNAHLERQVAERTQALQQSHNLLHAIAEAQVASLSVLKALRDEHGGLVDLEFLFANSVAHTLAGGQPLVGQRYRSLFPEVVAMGLWEVFCHVLETGELAEREFTYAEGAGGGSGVHIVVNRLGDDLLVYSEDITARKLAEQERTKALRLLEQSEAVASIGSWDYELTTGRATWSAGMYRLYGQPPHYPTTPPHYLTFVVDADRPLAERLVGGLLAGASSLEETLRLRVGDEVKTVRVKAVLLPGETGQPGRMLGVDLDISDMHRLEAENQALRLNQQKELLLAILQAQETERNRLAESLHNGLGQLLYAIKLQVGQLDVPALHALPALRSVRSHVDLLLAEAITQTRTLSHELMPALLTEKGLGPALRDLCRNLTTPQCHFSCQVWLGEQELPQSLQMAIYRLAQELTHNIAKHAGASQAQLECEVLTNWISLRAEDNGRGFDPTATAKGLGLRLLHDAVSLLGGIILLDSSPEYGTHIRLRIPITL